MKVILAESAGFCFGVDKAVKNVYDHIGDEPLYTYGPIIHNPQVVKDLENKGVHVVHTIDELSQIEKGNMIIRSHGVGEKIYLAMEEEEFNIIDATCPYVKKIHRIVNEFSKKGDTIIIVGDADHPEIIGIKGWSVSHPYIIATTQEAETLDIPMDQTLCIVAQTTFNTLKFKEIIEIFVHKGYHVDIKDTICSATRERQQAAIELSSKVDQMIVIGGRNSSNTKKLFQLCKNQCDKTYHIETIEDLEKLYANDDEVIGITAGASTPKNIIQEVITHVRTEFCRNVRGIPKINSQGRNS